MALIFADGFELMSQEEWKKKAEEAKAKTPPPENNEPGKVYEISMAPDPENPGVWKSGQFGGRPGVYVVSPPTREELATGMPEKKGPIQ